MRAQADAGQAVNGVIDSRATSMPNAGSSPPKLACRLQGSLASRSRRPPSQVEAGKPNASHNDRPCVVHNMFLVERRNVDVGNKACETRVPTMVRAGILGQFACLGFGARRDANSEARGEREPEPSKIAMTGGIGHEIASPG